MTGRATSVGITDVYSIPRSKWLPFSSRMTLSLVKPLVLLPLKYKSSSVKPFSKNVNGDWADDFIHPANLLLLILTLNCCPTYVWVKVEISARHIKDTKYKFLQTLILAVAVWTPHVTIQTSFTLHLS
jgi:hypothetical protein